ncbi:TPA: hypothetical protein N2G31_003691, partial [Salmonella enterica]|nr:hypothetical protein [Salmonella enterica]
MADGIAGQIKQIRHPAVHTRLKRKEAHPDGRASSLSESAVYAGPLLRNV